MNDGCFKPKIFIISLFCFFFLFQATFRYYSACGLKPVLSLSTAEGALLSPDDRITDVLSNNEQVIASIENWDLPPLVERYKSACLSADTGNLPYDFNTTKIN